MCEGQTRATNNGNVPRGFYALGAPNWLAAESVSATKCLPPRCKMRVHAQCQSGTTNKRRENDAFLGCARMPNVTTIARQ